MASRTSNVYPRTRKDGKTVYDVMLTFYEPGTGQRKQRMKTFGTKKAALDALAQNRTDNGRGQAVLPNKRTLGQLLEDWLSAHSATLKPASIRQYRTTIDKHIAPYMGHRRLEELTAHDLEQHYAALRRHGVGVMAIDLAHRRMSQALDFAKRHRWVLTNVARDADKPTAKVARRPVWNDGQLSAFLAVSGDTRFGPIFTLAALSGMRRGELLGLEWGDVDEQAGVLHVRHNLVWLDDHYERGTTKTGQERAVAVPRWLMAQLHAHRRRQAEWRLQRGPLWQEPDLVFTTALGTTIKAPNLRVEFLRLCALADVPIIHLHDVRHSHATFLLNQGWTVVDVAARLGHGDTTTTMNTYLHALPDRYGQMVERMALQLGVPAGHEEKALP